MASDPIPPGAEWLPARYPPIRRLGAGGMGEVWLAHDIELDRPVAVKRLLQRTNDVDRLRFRREFMVLSQLDYPGIIKVFDMDESEAAFYYTMEFLDGAPLRDYFRAGLWQDTGPGQGGTHTPGYYSDAAALQRLWSVGLELFATLAYLHSNALIHRDLKPANLMVDGAGRLRLLDFGLARKQAGLFDLAGESSAGVTRAGEMVGTPSYLAPEQIKSQPVDARADLYSAGVILYEMTTGQLPFRGASIAEVLMGHLQYAPKAPRSVNPLLTPDQNAFIMRLLAKEPAGRYPSALEGLRAMRACALALDSEALTTALVSTGEMSAPRELLVAPWTGNKGARDAALEAARALLSGQGRGVLIGGPPGSGKSRLFDELRGFAAEQGLKVLSGAARQAAPVPAQLFHELFAALAEPMRRHPERATLWLGEEAGLLARHFPVLAEWSPSGTTNPQESAALEPQAERARLMAAVYCVFARLAREAPLLLLLDDLHWADPLSLDLTVHLLRSFTSGAASGQPQLALIGCYRNDGASLSEPFARWLQQIGGGGLVRQTLHPLDPSATGELVQALLGMRAPPPERFTRRLLALTGGNPWFLIETIKTLIASGELQRVSSSAAAGDAAAEWNFEEWLQRESGASPHQLKLPESVQAAIDGQVASLSEAARTALRSAALIGRDFKFAWWQKVSGLDEAALLDLADPLIRAGFLIEKGADTLALAHEQLRAALVAGLTGLKRRRLHGAILAALEADPQAAADPALLAEHALEAGAAEPALRHGLKAAEALILLQQPEPALRLLERIEALQGGRAKMAPAGRLALVLLLFRGYYYRGDYLRILEIGPDTIKLAQEAGDAKAEKQLWTNLAYADIRAGDARAGLESAQIALALAEASGDERTACGSLSNAAAAHLKLGELELSRQLGLQSHRRAVAAGEHLQASIALTWLGILAFTSGDNSAAIAHWREGLVYDEKSGNKSGIALQTGNIGETLVLLGKLDEAEAALQKGYALNREIGKMDSLSDNLNNLGRIALLRGEYEKAREILSESLLYARESGDMSYQVISRLRRMEALASMGDFAAAQADRTVAVESARAGADPYVLALALSVAADFALLQGEAQAAREDAEAALAISDKQEMHAITADALAARGLAGALAGEGLRLDDFERALALARKGDNVELELMIALRRGQALLLTGDDERGGALLADVIARAEKLGFNRIAQRAKVILPG
jgi:tRNA A-37 threonylcarbamoyl transferase component Bud32